MLRAEFEATRVSDRDRERERPEQAPPAARVGTVRLLDDAGEPVRTVRPGRDLTVSVEVCAPEGLTDWVLGIGIDTVLGQSVYGTNTKLMGLTMPPLSGTRTYAIRLPGVWLGEGQYSVHGALAESSGVEIDRRPEAVTFTVEADGHSIGYLHTEPVLLPE